MRLTAEQAAIIRNAAAEVFGADARVWLFGSRSRVRAGRAPCLCSQCRA